METFVRKNAVVTGGAGGIGYSICKELLKNHIENLAIIDVQDNNVIDKLKSKMLDCGSRILFVNANVTDQLALRKAFKKVLEKFGNISVLVNAVGILDEDKIQLMVDVNLIGVINSCTIGMNLMSRLNEGEGGCIINIASLSGLVPFFQTPVYSTTKAALITYTKLMAQDLNSKQHDVNFVTICPGPTRTKFIKGLGMPFPIYKFYFIPGYVLMIRRLFGTISVQKPNIVGRCAVSALESKKTNIFWISNGSKNVEVDVMKTNCWTNLSISKINTSKMKDIAGKNAVVTGGAGGIGFAICRQLLLNNVQKLAIIDIKDDENAVEQLQQEFPKATVLFVKSSVATQNEIEEAYKVIMENFGKIYLILNCAGIFDEKKPQLTVDINLCGVIHSSMTGMSLMSKSNGGEGGYVISIASVVAFTPMAINPVYCASKSAVVNFTQAMGQDFYFNKHGVKFMAICPGVTQTNLIGSIEERVADSDLKPIIKEIAEKFVIQEPKNVGECVLQVIKSDKNGSIWMSDNGKNSEIDVTFNIWKV